MSLVPIDSIFVIYFYQRYYKNRKADGLWADWMKEVFTKFHAKVKRLFFSK